MDLATISDRYNQSIVGWETVNSAGEIVYVDAEKEPELAVAMRGSGSQFGRQPLSFSNH